MPSMVRWRPGHRLRPVDLLHQRVPQDVVDQRRLPAATHPGDGHEAAEGELDVDVVEVVLPGASHGDPVVTRAPAHLRHRDLAPAREVGAGDRPRRGHQVVEGALDHDLATVDAGAGPDVDDVVGDPDRLLVVLDHDHRVAQVAQADHGVDEAAVVTLVEADRRLVEDVQDADQAAADLRRQADPLRLAAGQRARRPGQRQVVEAHVEQEGQPLVDLLEDPLGDHPVALRQLQPGEEPGRVADGQAGDLVDVLPADLHRQRGRPQPGAATVRARHLPHVALDLLPGAVALRLGVAPLQPGDDALVAGGVGPGPAVAVAVLHQHLLAAGAVEDDLAVGRLQLLPRCRRGELVGVGHGLQDPAEVLAPEPGPGGDGPAGDRQLVVAHDQLRVDLEAGPEPVAPLAGAVGGVEGEVAGRQLVEGQAAGGAGEVLGEGEGLALDTAFGGEATVLCGGHPRTPGILGHDLDLGHPFGQPQRRLQRVGQAALDTRPAHEPVDDHLDGVLLVPRQAGASNLCSSELEDLAVDPGPGVALLPEVGQQRLVLALAAPHHRRQHLEPCPLGQLQHPVDDLLGGLAGDLLAALGAVGHPDPGVEQAQVVVDLGDRPDRGPGVARRRLLVDRDRRGEALDEVDVGLVHLAQELPGVGRQRLDVAPLALGVDGVERQRRLARPRQAGEDDQLVARQLDADVLEVVLPGAPDDQRLGHEGSEG